MIQIKGKKGFTLVELLAVIVILAIILVIAVPKVMSIIEDAKMGTLESTAKMIASAAEKQKVQNTVLGNDAAITCEGITNINKEDYPSCEITFDDNTAKVTIVGGGKFDGLYVCGGTKTDATATVESCTPAVNVSSFANDDWSKIIATVQSGNYSYQVGDTKTIELGNDLGKHTIRVSNTTPCSEVEVESKTACGFVLEFADIIIRRGMNETWTNAGGWPASEMRTYVNSDIYNSLPEDLKNAIINTYVVSGSGLNGTEGGLEDDNAGILGDNNYWSNDKLYFLSTIEVWGSDPSGHDTISNLSITRQLDYYEMNGVSPAMYEQEIYGKPNTEGLYGCHFLRSPRSNSDQVFNYVGHSYGDNDCEYYDTLHVSPAFRIAD